MSASPAPGSPDDSLLMLIGLGLALIVGDVLKLRRRMRELENAHNRTVFDQMNRDFFADQAKERAEVIDAIVIEETATPEPPRKRAPAKPRGPRTGNVTKSA